MDLDMENSDEEGSSSLVEEISGEREKTVPEEVAEPMAGLSAGEGAGGRRKLISGAVGLMVLSAAFGLMFYFTGEEEKDPASGRIKIVALKDIDTAVNEVVEERIYYEIAPFFIPLEEGRSFLKLSIVCPNIRKDLAEKIESKPYIYREAILGVFEGEPVSDLIDHKKRNSYKSKVEAFFNAIAGKDAAGTVSFRQFKLV